MTKKAFVVAALGLAAVLVAGGLVASNMGFKLNYELNGPADPIPGGLSFSGTQGMSLPYNQQTSILDADDLRLDIEAEAGNPVVPIVAQISRHVRQTDASQIYTGAFGVNFPITPGDGYKVQVTAGINYIIVGSHNPSLSLLLDGPGSNNSFSGTQQMAIPYHTTAVTAEDLIAEVQAAAVSPGVDPVVASISRHVRETDGSEIYTGSFGTNFTLTVGESYKIQVTQSVTFIPAHY